MKEVTREDTGNLSKPFVKIIKEICLENDITLNSFSFDWIFRLSKNGRTTHIMGRQFGNNSSTSQQICSDKCATSDILLFNNLPAVQHHYFMAPINEKYVSPSGNWEKLVALLRLHKKIVCKPNNGAGGNRVYLVNNVFELEQATQEIFYKSNSMAVCPYYQIDNEYRIVVLDNNVKLIFSKNIPFVQGDGKSTLRELLIRFAQNNIDHTVLIESSEQNNVVLAPDEKHYLHWQHNLGKGAHPIILEDKSLQNKLEALALQAANTVGITFASVDIIQTNNTYKILEINSGVMMDHFAETNRKNYEIAKTIYQEAILKTLGI